MKIELSQQTESLLKSLVSKELNLSGVVELAVIEFAARHGSQLITECHTDLEADRVFSEEELQQEIQKGIDDLNAGRVNVLDIDDIRRRGLERTKKHLKAPH